jgi:hypothetical protein
MICEACLEAGRFNKMANEANFQSTALAEILRVEARREHAKCKGCTCVHLVGDILNRKEIDAQTAASRDQESAAPAA